jgi:hypothetical protein
MEKKILGVLPKSRVNMMLASLVVTYIVALIWSWVMAQSFSAEHAWVTIIELIILAAIIGGAVGMFAGEARQSTLWIAAGFAVLGLVLVQGLMTNAGAGVDGATYGALQEIVFTVAVNGAAIVMGIVAAVAAAVTSTTEM